MAPLVAAVLGTALAYMSDDMLNLAIWSVARDLRATMTDVQWILNAYYVALVSFVLIAGSIGDLLGHRRVFTIGLGLFSLGSLACACAPALHALVAGGAVQGLGAAMLLTAGLALVTRLTPPGGATARWGGSSGSPPRCLRRRPGDRGPRRPGSWPSPGRERSSSRPRLWISSTASG